MPIVSIFGPELLHISQICLIVAVFYIDWNTYTDCRDVDVGQSVFVWKIVPCLDRLKHFASHADTTYILASQIQSLDYQILVLVREFDDFK